MERQIDLNEISDGRLYGLSDMVRADCGGCAGCSACCSGMGRSVVLDPLDMHRLAEGTGVGAETLLAENLELNVVDGIVLPNLKMTGGGGKMHVPGSERTLYGPQLPPGDLPDLPSGAAV